MHAQKASAPPFSRAVSPVMHALAQPQIMPSQVNYAIESVRKKWADAMLNDALSMMLLIGDTSAKHVRCTHASLQFGLVCAIYSGQREGMPDFERMKAPIAACVSNVKEQNGYISAPLALSCANALEIARRYTRNATSKAIYQTSQAVAQAQNANTY